jgi:hypothetical protein
MAPQKRPPWRLADASGQLSARGARGDGARPLVQMFGEKFTYVPNRGCSQR